MIKRQLWIVYLVVALVFTMMPFTGQVEMVSAANIASGTSGTCEWVIDGDGNLTVSPIDGDEGQLGNDLNQQWSSYAAQVKTVSFEGKISTKNCAALFRSFTNVMDINLSNLKTEGVKSMVQMFAGCGKLKSLDLSGLDTSNVIYTMDMFTGCSGLTEVDMSMLDLSKLRDADRMFANCTGLTQVDMSGQTMNSIENTTSMFYGCSNLKIINLSNIDISGGEVDTTWMLEGCQNLETLTLGPWDMSRVGEEYSWHGKATFPKTMYDETGKKYKEGTVIPDSKKAVTYYAYIHPYDSGFKIGIDSNAFRNNDYWFWPTILNTMPVKQKYLDDDVVERICEFLTIVYGADTLEENLDFIAKALGNKGLTSREVIRNYMLNDFFKDHCKTYSVTGSGKRPIYWLFDSGKENAFKALVYMHRWDADTTGRVLLYAQQIQQKYETEIRAIDMMLDHITDARQKSTEEKRQEHLKKQLEELVDYEERLEHMANERIAIDLDDGVKVNYEKVQTDRNGKKYQILASIK